jgi:hypothetical protein
MVQISNFYLNVKFLYRKLYIVQLESYTLYQRPKALVPEATKKRKEPTKSQKETTKKNYRILRDGAVSKNRHLSFQDTNHNLTIDGLYQ